MRCPRACRVLAATLAMCVILPSTPSMIDAQPTAAFDPLQTETIAAAGPSAMKPKTIVHASWAPGKTLVRTTFPAAKIAKGPNTPAGPIAFTPFAPVNAQGAPVSPSDAIVDPYDHNKQVNAGQYWAAVNQYEKNLNARGYTLRVPGKRWDPGRVVGASQPEYLATVRAKLLSGPPALPAKGNTFSIVLNRTKLGLFPASDSVVKSGSKAFVVVPYAGPTKPPTGPSYHVASPTPSPTPSPKPTFNSSAAKNISTSPPSNMKNPNSVCSFAPQGIGHNAQACPTPHPYYGPTLSPAGEVEEGLAPPAAVGLVTAPPNALAVGNFFSPLGIKDPSLKYAPLVPQPPTVTSDNDTIPAIDFPWSSEWGDPSLADFYANADLNSSVNLSMATLTTAAQAAAGAHILGIGGDIASASLTLTGNQGSIDVELIGQSVYSKSGTTAIADSTSDSETFVNISVPIPILFFDVIISGSITGSMSLGYQLALTALDATGSASLTLALNAQFQANVGIDFGVGSISAGVYGSMTIANVTFPFGVSVGFTVLNTMNGTQRLPANIIGCQLAFFHDMTLDLDYSLLSGSFGVDAQACIIFLGCDTADLPIVNWSGSTGSVPIISDPGATSSFGATPVGTIFSDLPQYGLPLPPGAVYSQDDGSGMPAVCDVLNTAEST